MRSLLLLSFFLLPHLLVAQAPMPVKDLETTVLPLSLQADSLLVYQRHADGYTFWNKEGGVEDGKPSYCAIQIRLQQEGSFAAVQLPLKNLYNDPRQSYPVYRNVNANGKPYNAPRRGWEQTPYWGVDVQYICQGQPRTASFRFCNRLVDQASYLCHAIDGVWQPQQFIDFDFHRPVFEVLATWDGTVFSYNYNRLLNIPDRVERVTGITCWVGSGAQLRIGPEVQYSVFNPRSKVPF